MMEQQLYFIHIPKTAGTTIRESFPTNFNVKFWHEFSVHNSPCVLLQEGGYSELANRMGILSPKNIPIRNAGRKAD